MLHEPASSEHEPTPVSQPLEASDPDPSEQAYQDLQTELYSVVDSVMEIDSQLTALENVREQFPELFAMLPDSTHVASFNGHLRVESSVAFGIVDHECDERDLILLLRAGENSTCWMHVFSGRLRPVERPWGLNFGLFVLTLLSVLYVGTTMAINEIAAEDFSRAVQLLQNFTGELWRGLPYALSILLILGAHELGHYFAARHHRLAVSLPYFIPFPVGLFGTLGAFINLREPLRNRKMLFDVGVAGPLAGLVFAVPILFIGLATSQVDVMTPGYVEGNSIFYALAKFAVFGEFLPGGGRDVYVNQLAWAGWTGLFVTGLNLIPVGQLDGGHVLYSLIGKRARLLFYPAIAVLGVITIITQGSMLFILILLLLFGRAYAVPQDDLTPLDSRRRWLGVMTLVIFVLVFVPVPLMEVRTVQGGIPMQGARTFLPALLAGVMIFLWQKGRRI